ncbi:ImmA/IrrE family metallo-endopeptidase [Tunicatimonas pelagia]|uniref:ImmA/IrrE family metallo-endopeptidase n=1 Tax=Tunicatimonas pelagia TaxID=931531 RepID=UPI00266698C4|nr:ImmA/IrrE family metallo-endopeptidase [Tunicatimonas pelagia]WKN42119.1 ImmA/IrrE family metallo-endopeptidase [Tunicatimonas pelagia]
MLDNINPHMITLGRESRGMSQSVLAKKIGVSQGKLSKAEKGEQSLPDSAFKKLTRVLAYPDSFFFTKTPTAPVSHYYYRKKVTIPQKTIAQIEAIAKIFRQNIDSLAEAVELPETTLISFNPDEETPEEIARKTRYFFKIPRGPVPNLVNLLENKGILVVKTDLFTEKIDGLSTISDKGIHIIFLNERMSHDRQRFSLSHELGHMLMHFDIPNISEDVEDEANRFASEFLMPRDEIINSLRSLNFPKLGELKRYWKVSMRALVQRAKQLGTINSNEYRNLQIGFSKRGMTKSEAIQLPEEKAFILDEVVKLHLNELDYSVEELANILGLNTDEFKSRFTYSQRPKLKIARMI